MNEETINWIREMAIKSAEIVKSLAPDGKRADKESDDFWIAALKEKFPNDKIITEESFIPKQLENLSGRVWVVDPLDGTSSFSKGYSSYTIMVSLMDNKKLLFSMVIHPPTGNIYHAVKGKGAFLNNKHINVTSIKNVEDMRMVHRHTMSNNLDNIIESLNTKEKSVMGSLGLKLSLIASGDFDITVYDSGPKLWDILPGALILEEAGGKITDLIGNNVSVQDLNSKGILATNGSIHEEILGDIQSKSKMFEIHSE